MKNSHRMILLGSGGIGAESLVKVRDTEFLPILELKPSAEIMAFIREKEGFRAAAYWDKTGRRYTIGYGTTVYLSGEKVKKGDTITEERARIEQEARTHWFGQELQKVHPNAVLSQNQFDALCSFLYNFGTTKYKEYSIRKQVDKDPNYLDEMKRLFSLYVYSGKTKLPGLVTRRAEEANIYASGDYENVIPLKK